MSKSYGECVGCNAALTWVRELKNVNDSIRERVLHRMMYEFDKDIPVKPKYHKGKYGKQYDSFSCQNWISEAGLSNATVAIIEADKE